MSHPSARALAGLLAAGMLLAGCSSDPDPVAGTSPSARPSTSAEGEASASASPSSTLTPEEQQALDEATEAVLAVRQTFYDDLSATPAPNLNDMNNVAAGPQLLDWTQEPPAEPLRRAKRQAGQGGTCTRDSAEPVKLDLDGDPPTVVVVRACVDATAVKRGPEWGKTWTVGGSSSDYRVVKTDLPSRPWMGCYQSPAA